MHPEHKTHAARLVTEALVRVLVAPIYFVYHHVFAWACMRVGFGRGRRTNAGALLSFGRDVMARTGWEAKFRSLVFVGFVHIFATARWLPLKQIFRHVFILALCLLSLPI